MSNLTPRIDRLEKNYIINGNFDFWQRGTSFISTNGVYQADRFQYASDGTPTDVTQQTDVPTSLAFMARYSYKCARISTNIPGVNEVSYITYKMEGHDFRAIRNKDITIAFWVKSTKIGTYCLKLADNGYQYTILKEYTINVANTWERKVINLTLSDAAGSWLYDNGTGLRIFWMLQAGTNRRGASPNTWFTLGGPSTASWSTSNQVNLFDTANASIQIAQVELLEGTYTSPEFYLSGRDWASELRLCQRYYSKSYLHNDPPGSITATGIATMYTQSAQYFSGHITFKAMMRNIPAVRTYNHGTGTIDQARGITGGGAVALGAQFPSESGFSVYALQAIQDIYGFHWIADAEL